MDAARLALHLPALARRRPRGSRHGVLCTRSLIAVLRDGAPCMEPRASPHAQLKGRSCQGEWREGRPERCRYSGTDWLAEACRRQVQM
jgi:hypothetical protein